MGKFILSKSTQDDIDDIFSYGTTHFGNTIAIEYLVELNSCFTMLAEQPGAGRNRDEIKRGLLSFPFKSHIIFYRVFKDHIRIVRVFYGGRDLVKAFRS